MGDQLLFGQAVVRQRGLQPAGAHHRDAVRQADQLHQLGRDHDHAAALCGQPLDQEIDVALGADVDAARRLVEHDDTRPGCSTFASASFCWLPPDSEPARSVSEPVRMPNSPTARCSAPAPRRGAATAARSA
jgi:hypothetical protein